MKVLVQSSCAHITRLFKDQGKRKTVLFENAPISVFSE